MKPKKQSTKHQLKTKRRKTRAERNQIRQQKVTKTVEKQEARKRMESMVSNRHGYETLEKKISVFGTNRLTRRIGLFNQGKKSVTIFRDSHGKTYIDKENDIHPDLLSNPVIPTEVSCSDASVGRCAGTLDSIHGQYRRLKKPTPDIQHNTRNDSPMDTDRKSTTEAGFPESPPIEAVSAIFREAVNLKKLFPGRNYCESVREDLHTMMSLNSETLNSYQTPLTSSSSAPASRKPTPHSYLLRGSLSSETVKRHTEHKDTRQIIETEDTNRQSCVSKKRVDRSQSCSRLDRGDMAKNIQEVSGSSLRHEIPGHNISVDQIVNTSLIHRAQPIVNKAALTIDVLTDARALLDYNDQVNRTLQSTKEVMSISSNPVDLSATSSHLYVNANHKLTRVQCPCEIPPGYLQSDMNLDKVHSCDMSSHKCQRRDDLTYCVSRENSWIDQSSAMPSAEHNFVCGNRHSFKADLWSSSTKCPNFEIQGHNQSQYFEVGAAECHEDGQWIPPIKQHQPDLLDYIDLEPSSTGYSDLDVSLSRQTRCHHNPCVDPRIPQYNRVTAQAHPAKAFSYPDSDASPIWYPPTHRIKPRLDTPSPEKMLPHKLF